MSRKRREEFFVKRKDIHSNFDGEVFTDDGDYAKEYTEWLEDSIMSSADSLIYNIDDFKNRMYFYSQKLEDENLSEEDRKKFELKYKNMNSRVIGMETFGLRTLNKIIKKQ